jgi:CubicO group peptidase (beta-lactamase class C family)
MGKLDRLIVLLTVILVAVGMVSAGPPREAIPTTFLDEPALVSAAAVPIEPAVAPESIAQLREKIAAVLEREQVPGVGLALVDREGLIWAGGVGVADVDTQKPVTADTVFRVASITKSFVALGVMRLVEQGQLSLDEPLRERMPEIEMHNRWADTDPVTLAHALEHTAGFDDMGYCEYFGDEGMAPREALAINPRSRVSRWRPGTRMSYSNPGYTIAGHAIELATGEPWDRYLEREVLRPLGMHTASFRRTPELVERLATGYDRFERPVVFESIAHAPAGSLLTSPRELAKLVHFWLRRGDAPIVGAASLARIEQTQTLPYLGTDMNYGLGNYGDVWHPVRSRGHDGGIPGFLSAYRYFPELGVGYVMLLNGTHSVQAYLEIRALMFAYLTRGRELPAPPISPRDDEAIADAVGFYAFSSPRKQLFGFMERALLGVELRPSAQGIELELLAGGRIEMVPTGDGGFRHPREGGTSVRVARNAKGEQILLAGGGYHEAGSGAWARARLWALQGACVLMPLAVVWGLAWMLVAGIGRMRGRPPAPETRHLHLRPAIAALSFMAIPMLLTMVFARGAYTDANAWSVALCGATLLFPACSAAALVGALRSRALGSFWVRALPSAGAVACFGMAVYLAVNGIVGLRIWLC